MYIHCSENVICPCDYGRYISNRSLKGLARCFTATGFKRSSDICSGEYRPNIGTHEMFNAKYI